MKNTLDLNKMGLVELNQNEMENVIGGSFWSAIGNAIVSAANWVADNAVAIVAIAVTTYAAVKTVESNLSN